MKLPITFQEQTMSDDIQSYQDYMEHRAMREDAIDQPDGPSKPRHWPSIPEANELEILRIAEELKAKRAATPDDCKFTTNELIAACTNYVLRNLLTTSPKLCNLSSTPKIEHIRAFAERYSAEVCEMRRQWGLYYQPDFIDVEDAAGKPVRS